MIALSRMFPTFGHAWHAPTERLVRARESCDQSKSQSAFSVHGQGENARVHPAGAFVARVIIPPRSTAILSDAGTTQRDDHLRSIEQHGRLGWQRRSGYGRRSLVETAMYRYKTIIGGRLRARSLLNQRIETKIGCYVLNRMTSLGMPVSIRVK
jgi:hypothetical protein